MNAVHRWLGKIGGIVAGLLLVASWPLASAQQSSSSHYQVNEVYFGAGGDLNDCSSHYCAKESAGELNVGNTKSTNYQAQGGFDTDRAPYIAFTVSSSSVDLGVLTMGAAATTTATFSVKSYLASGYIVQIASNPPVSNGASPHTLTGLTSSTASSPGTEQFGMNLVANTTGCGAPANFGAAAVQVPDSTFSFGAAATGYNTCGLFKYVKGDTIASSAKSSGETDYTASYIYNISNVTPDGQYSYNGVFVATATY